MSDLLSPFLALPAYGIGGLAIVLLYALQSEIRFGVRARTIRTGDADKKSTLIVSICSAVPVVGFVLAMKENSSGFVDSIPRWFRDAVIPGLPLVAWTGVSVGVAGLAIRLAAVLTLRERYTRTLMVGESHTIERNGPYRWVRHPGYLGSLLCLNGVALASGNLVTAVASLVATLAAYAYRIKVEDEMLVASLGAPYAQYRREVRALLPLSRSASDRLSGS